MNYSVDWDDPGERDHECYLLPCPFCGSDATFDKVTDQSSPDFGGHFVRCTQCLGSVGLQYANKEDPRRGLAEKWNRRDGWRPMEDVPKDGATVEVRGVMQAHHLRGCKFAIMPRDWRPDTPQTEWRLTDWRPAPKAEAAAVAADDD